MVLSMVRPTPHSKTGVFYYRGRVPADLHKLKGKGLAVTVAGEQARVTLGEHFKVSLRTKDPSEARSRNADVETQLQSHWSAARTGELGLTFEQVCALAGEWYRDEIASHEREPGNPHDWATMQGLISDALFYFEGGEDGRKRNPKMGEEQLLKLIPIDRFLEGRGLTLNSECRRSFVEQVGQGMWRMSVRLGQLAEGDYSEDKTLKTFPSWRGLQIAPERPSKGLLEVFERWAKEGERAPSTTQGYRG